MCYLWLLSDCYRASVDSFRLVRFNINSLLIAFYFVGAKRFKEDNIYVLMCFI